MPRSAVDLLILTALEDECDAVLKENTGAFCELNWENQRTTRDVPYATAEIIVERPFRLVVAQARGQGTEHMAAITTHMLHETAPACAALVGICAGSGREAQYCDVVIPSVVKKGYGGKHRAGEAIRPDGDQSPALGAFPPDEVAAFSKAWARTYAKAVPPPPREEQLKLELLQAFADHAGSGGAHPLAGTPGPVPDRIVVDKLISNGHVSAGRDGLYKLTAPGKRMLAELKQRPPLTKEFECVTGRWLVTGANVEQDDELFEKLQLEHSRDVVAFEREAYGFLLAVQTWSLAHYFIAKGVQDYADWGKCDRFRHYAARAAARFAVDFATSPVTSARLTRVVTARRTPQEIFLQTMDAESTAWSRSWTQDAAKPIERELLKADTTSAYIAGPPGSGKTTVVEAFVDLLSRSHPASKVIRIDMRPLLNDFIVHKSADELRTIIYRKIWSGLNPGYWRPDALRANIAEEITRITEESTDPCYVVFEDVDEGLKFGIDEVREMKVAVEPIFQALSTVLRNATKRNLRMIFTAERGANELSAAYPGSPFTSSWECTLERLTPQEMRVLASAAGLSAHDGVAVLGETGGHRSLVWAVLDSIRTEQSALEVARLRSMDLPRVAQTLRRLEESVRRQPALQASVDSLRSSNFPSREQVERLRGAMLLAPDGIKIGSSLLERVFLA